MTSPKLSEPFCDLFEFQIKKETLDNPKESIHSVKKIIWFEWLIPVIDISKLWLFLK